jgi:hypothetical protein
LGKCEVITCSWFLNPGGSGGRGFVRSGCGAKSYTYL